MASIETTATGEQCVRAELSLLPMSYLDTVTATLLIDNTGKHISFPYHPVPAGESLRTQYAQALADIAVFPLQGSSRVIVAETSTNEGLDRLLSWFSDEERAELDKQISQAAPGIDPANDLYAGVLRANTPLAFRFDLGTLDASGLLLNIKRALNIAERSEGGLKVVYGIFGAGPYDLRPEF